MRRKSCKHHPGLEQIPVHRQAKRPLLQFHRAGGDVQPQAAALGGAGGIPRTNRSVSSSADTLRGVREMLFTVSRTLQPCKLPDTQSPGPGGNRTVKRLPLLRPAEVADVPLKAAGGEGDPVFIRVVAGTQIVEVA